MNFSQREGGTTLILTNQRLVYRGYYSGCLNRDQQSIARLACFSSLPMKTVLITGSARGIGFALASLYHSNGWNVIATARNLDKVDQLHALAPYKLVQLDSGDEDSILKAAEALRDEKIDVLINNAGIGSDEDLEGTTKVSLLHQFEVNAVGPFLVTRAFLPQLRAAVGANGKATVAQISSIMSSISDNTMGKYYGYRSTKAALNMINKSLSIDLKPEGIFTVSLHPGYVATDMTEHKGAVQPGDSATGLAKVINELTAENAGKFIDFQGNQLHW